MSVFKANVVARNPKREMVKKFWGNDADPLAFKTEWEARLSKVSKSHFKKA